MKPTSTDWIQWCWTEGPNPPEGDGWTLVQGDPAVCAKWMRSVPAPEDDAEHMRLNAELSKELGRLDVTPEHVEDHKQAETATEAMFNRDRAQPLLLSDADIDALKQWRAKVVAAKNDYLFAVWPRIFATIAQLKADRDYWQWRGIESDALRALLRKHEWAGFAAEGGYGSPECPECLADPSDGHKPGCALKAAIG